jgi:3-hydroxybutyryl-CoA dehydratase
MEQEPAQLFLDDFAKGQTYPGATRTVTEGDVLSFAALTGDRHPIHYDAEYARSTRFGRPIVHGLHLMSLTALGATPLSERLREAMIAFVDHRARFLKPVFLGDEVRSEFEVEEVAHKAGRDFGRLELAVRLVNDRGETILEGRHVYLIRCRAEPTRTGEPA